MKIFVGYGYNPRDQWIEDLVFRLIHAFNATPVHGKVTYGHDLDAEIIHEIGSCNAVIGFRTRREESATPGIWRTHSWVDHELLTAANLPARIPVLEVRETSVEEPAGMLQQALQGRQRIHYNEAHRDRCLVEIAQAVGRWKRDQTRVQFTLLPDDFGSSIRPLLRDPDLRCVYRVLGEDDTDVGPEQAATIHRLPRGQMTIRTGAVPTNSSIMVEVWMGRTRLLWNSDLQPVDSRTIHLEKVS